MTGILKRSLLQLVAAVVLFAGAGASDLFAGDQTITVTTGGPTPSTVVFTLWRLTTVNGPPTYVLQPVNDGVDEDGNPKLDSDGRMPMDFLSTTNLNYQWIHTYDKTLTSLTPGTRYAATYEIQSGTLGNYTYTTINSTTYWIE